MYSGGRSGIIMVGAVAPFMAAGGGRLFGVTSTVPVVRPPASTSPPPLPVERRCGRVEWCSRGAATSSPRADRSTACRARRARSRSRSRSRRRRRRRRRSSSLLVMLLPDPSSASLPLLPPPPRSPPPPPLPLPLRWWSDRGFTSPDPPTVAAAAAPMVVPADGATGASLSGRAPVTAAAPIVTADTASLTAAAGAGPVIAACASSCRLCGRRRRRSSLLLLPQLLPPPSLPPLSLLLLPPSLSTLRPAPAATGSAAASVGTGAGTGAGAAAVAVVAVVVVVAADEAAPSLVVGACGRCRRTCPSRPIRLAPRGTPPPRGLCLRVSATRWLLAAAWSLLLQSARGGWMQMQVDVIRVLSSLSTTVTYCTHARTHTAALHHQHTHGLPR